MFKWFTRDAPPPARPKRPARSAQPPRSASDPAADPPLPAAALPQVVAEGNSQADWSVWEDSMTALDSQLQDLAPAERVHVRDTRPAGLDNDDPFAGVARKRSR